MIGACSARPSADCSASTSPIIGAPFGPWEQVDLAAAVCEAGALGSLGTGLRTVDELRAQWRAAARADRPAVRHQPHQPAVRRGGVRGDARGRAGRDLVPHRRARRPHRPRPRRRHPLDPAGRRPPRGRGGRRGRRRRHHRPGRRGRRSRRLGVDDGARPAGRRPRRRHPRGRGRRHRRRTRAGRGAGARRPGRQHGHALPGLDRDGESPRQWKRRIVEADALDAVKVVNSERVMPPYTRPGSPIEPRRCPRR